MNDHKIDVGEPNLIFIVPYRDREQQYRFFSNHMKGILEDIDDYRILYIHQIDSRSFNRGAMKNIGFLVVKNLYPDTYKNKTLVFNDVDTMPFTKNFFNYYTETGSIKHFYGFKFALGGIVSITAGDFENLNGFPNFWSWGYEDNALNDRAKKANINIDRSHFYPILDKNILLFCHGIERVMNKKEYSVFTSNTKEGISCIKDLQYQIKDDDFVDVSTFNTNRAEDVSARYNQDLRKQKRSARNPIMKMSL